MQGKKCFFIIFKELHDALITVKKKKKTAFPKGHCASVRLNAKLDVKIPYVIAPLFRLPRRSTVKL